MRTIVFADDESIFIKCNTILRKKEIIMNYEITKISMLHKINKLSLNIQNNSYNGL